MNKLKVGIIGLGAIGREIGKQIILSNISGMKLEAVSEKEESNIEKFNIISNSTYKNTAISDLISLVDIVIESATAKISYDIAYSALSKGKKVMILSVGGLVNNFSEIQKIAEEKNGKLFIPSGAICGIDGLKAASCGKIYSVNLTTRKPPKGFSNVQYLIDRNIDIEKIEEETVLFEGNASEAVKAFPKNINVSLTLSLSGLGPDKTKVKILADPNCKSNIHEIFVEGDFGKFNIKTENEPSPSNPGTSYLAILSAINMLKNMNSSIQIGG